MTQSIAVVRKAALAEKQRLGEIAEKANRITIPKEVVASVVSKAVAKILTDVENRPELKHHYDHWFGNLTTSQEQKDAWLKAVQDELVCQGYGEELIAEESQFSNIGDPYFMGGEANRIQYSIRISTIV